MRDLVPDQPDSLYELGYMTVGRCSIFFLASVFVINALGLCILYFIVFGDTALAIVLAHTDELEDAVWYTSRTTYCVPLAAVLLPIVLKKELAEFAWISYILFCSLTLFVIVNFIQLVFDSNFDAQGVNEDLLNPKVQWSTISAVSATMVAYSYQQNVMPIYSELKNKTSAEYASVSQRGLLLTGSIYWLVGTLCGLMFGHSLESSVLLNISAARHADDIKKSFWEALICQVAFCLVLMCHVPFIFFSGKEAMLICIDEVMRKSISNALWHKLQANEHF